MADTQAKLSKMLTKFGVVTVMDVDFYKTVRFTKDGLDDEKTELGYEIGDWDSIATFGADPIVHLDTLKISNINMEGPTKTATGGMNADTLLKYGKTMTIEMNDAMGRIDVLTNLYGANLNESETILAITDRFPGEYTIVGSTFFIDQATGAKQPLKIVIPVFLGDGIFNLTQDAEGDVTVFDLNGSILRFTNGHVGKIEDGKYLPGGDNQFYFMATEEGYEKLAGIGTDAEDYLTVFGEVQTNTDETE